MIEVSEFKRGVSIVYRDAPMMIVDVQFSTPTARGGSTIAKTKLRNLLTGQLITESIRSGDRYTPVDLEQRPCTFLYSDGDSWHFMDEQSFEQFALTKEQLDDKVGYLIDGIQGVRAYVVEERVVDLLLPNTVDLEVIEADPAIKGATAQAQLKRVKVETGIEVMVPAYVTAGERIRIDTRDAHFVERVK